MNPPSNAGVFSRSGHRVDVVIPAYNAVATIADTIASLRRQTFSDFRILVIDDGSTDDTGGMVLRLCEDNVRIDIITQPNRGIVEARNAGLLAARAEFIAVQDADDLSDPDRLERLVAHLDSYPSCVAVSGAARHIDASGRPTGGRSIMPPLSSVDAYWVPAREPYLMPFGLIRRSALLQVGGYRHVDYAEDTDLYWRLREVGELCNLPDVIGSYRFHALSATGGGSLVNTRVLATNNQLAAVSSLRRKAGRPDVLFERDRLDSFRRAGSLAGIFALAADGLDRSERTRFRAAVAAKMLQWLEGRHIVPERADCDFLKAAFAGRPTLAPENERELRRLYSVIGARLIRRGQVALASSLLPFRFRPEALARSLSGRC